VQPLAAPAEAGGYGGVPDEETVLFQPTQNPSTEIMEEVATLRPVQRGLDKCRVPLQSPASRADQP